MEIGRTPPLSVKQNFADAPASPMPLLPRPTSEQVSSSPPVSRPAPASPHPFFSTVEVPVRRPPRLLGRVDLLLTLTS